MNPTFDQWCREWLLLYVQPSRLAPRTVEMYTRCAGLLSRHLGPLPLDTLTPLDIQRALVEIARAAPRTAQQCRVTASRCIRTARKIGLTSCTIDADTVPMIDHEPDRAAILTPDELRQYIRAAMSSPAAVPLLLCCCGLRRSEALGVRWEDVSGNVLTVTRQRYRTARTYDAHPLKSRSSARALILPDILLQTISTQPRSLSGWLCDITPEQLRVEHRRVMAAIGAEGVTLHGLRHSIATAAAEEGRSMKLLQQALGHSSYTITADLYADHLGPVSALPAEVVEDIVTGEAVH